MGDHMAKLTDYLIRKLQVPEAAEDSRSSATICQGCLNPWSSPRRACAMRMTRRSFRCSNLRSGRAQPSRSSTPLAPNSASPPHEDAHVYGGTLALPPGPKRVVALHATMIVVTEGIRAHPIDDQSAAKKPPPLS